MPRCWPRQRPIPIPPAIRPPTPPKPSPWRPTRPPIVDPGIPADEPYFTGLRQLYAQILSTPADRPSFWGQPSAAGGDQYTLDLCDNGMLVRQWTVNWGDGSPPQTVSDPSSLTHAYAGGANQYQIAVTALSVDGKFTGGMGVTPGALDQNFDGGSGGAMDMSSHGLNPNWATEVGSRDSRRRTSRAAADSIRPPPRPSTTETSSLPAPRPTTSSASSAIPTPPGSPNDGQPDTSFGSGGLVTTTFALGNASASAVAVDQANATMVVAGTVVDGNGDNEVALARYNDADGSPDTTFGSSDEGTVTTDLGSGWQKTSAVVVESDNSILVAGEMSGQFAVLHYNSDGTQDTSFGGASSGVAT